jgi:hypothetical protein
MQRMNNDTNDEDPNIGDGGTLFVIYVCQISHEDHCFSLLDG